MLCEIEFRPVGDKSKAGDAIVVRYGEIDNYQIMLVDGGTMDAGETLAGHLKSTFGGNVQIEHIVLTHSDADHASGLRAVLRDLPVKNVWLHIPWNFAAEAKHLFKDSRWTDAGLSQEIKKEYDIVSEIVDLAKEKGCNIYYPFQGATIGPFTVLSPSKMDYIYLLPQFDKTPEPDQKFLEGLGVWIGKATTNRYVLKLQEMAAKVRKWLPENWTTEHLRDGGVTSASNESSVVLYADCGNERRILLTGDAGNRALHWAKNFATSKKLTLKKFSFVQIPHHGSRRNVGPTILNELIGPVQPKGTNLFSAYVSAPADDEDHPKKIVLNAFMRRGGSVFATQGQSKIHRGGFPSRPGNSSAEPMSFSDKVESYD